jgi:hypothetical protein
VQKSRRNSDIASVFRHRLSSLLKMNALASLLQSIPDNKWNLHEKVVCRRLQLNPKEAVSVRNQLGQLISVLKRGGSGNKKAGTWKPTDFGSIDLSDENNKLNIHYSSNGKKETFATDTLADKSDVSGIPRYFRFGRSVRITVPNQLCLLGHVTGDVSKGLDAEIRERRQQTRKGLKGTISPILLGDLLNTGTSVSQRPTKDN